MVQTSANVFRTAWILVLLYSQLKRQETFEAALSSSREFWGFAKHSVRNTAFGARAENRDSFPPGFDWNVGNLNFFPLSHIFGESNQTAGSGNVGSKMAKGKKTM